MTPGARRIPDPLLECYLADALDAEAKARLDALLADSPEDRARLEALRADSAAFLLHHPPGPLVARFQKEQRRARWWRWPALLIPVVAAAAILPLLLPPAIDPPYTVKGTVTLVLHRKVDEGSAPVPPDATLLPGDALRFEVKADASGFVAVLSRDARGTITIYYPYGGTAAAPYDVSQPILPGAIELDDTLGREDVYVLHSTQPFELGWAVRALEDNQPLEQAAPRGVAVGSTDFIKRAEP